MERTNKPGTLERFEYTDWAEFVTYVEESLAPGKAPHVPHRGALDIRYDFHGVPSAQEAFKLARQGWADGMSQAKAIADSVERKLTHLVQRDTLHYDVQGEMLDVGRFCSGEPEHWGYWVQDLVEGTGTKFFHIVANGSASCGVDKSIMIHRGASLAALVNLMELSGYRVKITVVFAGGGQGAKVESVIPVKNYDEPVDLDKLAFSLAHPASFRLLGLASWDTVSDKDVVRKVNIGSSYGHPASVETPSDLYLDKMFYGEEGWRSAESCANWVERLLKEKGVIK